MLKLLLVLSVVLPVGGVGAVAVMVGVVAGWPWAVGLVGVVAVYGGFLAAQAHEKAANAAAATGPVAVPKAA